MSESNLIALYSGQILDLAANIPLTGRLAAPQGSAKRRSPLCGSSLTVDLTLHEGRITDFAQDVRACALGQASAAILGQVVLGRSAAEIRQARDQLKAMLSEAGPVPDAPFEGYGLLAPAREFTNRHASILLALEASCDALSAAGA
ncbi:iron-sulfur cluster assembly scaffold protein [Pseudogemmobacter faecipullorum]|uniref:Iron-sulfur cluster assembly scaffold protein n=1 Tax=Pseudogemmobacter faecipullorum TaxID=2755041 RepID=A0ABS8CIX7_9RHOB|nr:iron-sulfur cluster assembly scaffold protein [Pseudogemmobacter faecipullorum]MCB5409095.1 iron-sulfur cluster assembly scaffold protein [Pseudogemmobacter faecipullorum]